ncbi:MAG TPA: HEAT repeat domain-containing protein, partial [Allosphingosinicella sp.]|nr:HEAT repeat domain-containing protein [Allosphingosinicella sp.]
AAARTFLDQQDEIASLIEAILAESAKDPFFRPPFHPLSTEAQTGLLLFQNPHLWIALCVSGVDMLAAKKAGPRGPASIAFTGVTSVYRFLKAGGATLSFWEAPRITEGFIASQAGNCRLTDRRKIEDGEEILIDGSCQGFVIEHADADLVYLQALARTGNAPLATEYDSNSLAFIGASSTDEASSRMQLMVSLLRTMDRQDALPLIEEALASPHFYTRWHIMRELLAMDAEAALPPLRRMAAADPHPEIRAAARQTLAMFFEGEEEAGTSPAEGEIACRA